jgi:UDP-glucose 4-epimerase
VLAEHRAQAVVHLAAIVEPPPGMTDAEVRDIDVGGTRNVVAACVAAGVDHLTVTSSGAAYGYHPSNAGAWLTEDAPLRGHDRFAYSANKRDVEALLADARREHPELAQLVLRPGDDPRADDRRTSSPRCSSGGWCSTSPAPTCRSCSSSTATSSR